MPARTDDMQGLARRLVEPLRAWFARADHVGVAAAYATNAGQSITTGAVIAIVDFEDVISDPLGLVATGASWAFTCPSSGLYLVSAMVLFDTAAAWASGERGLMQAFVNGTLARTLDRRDNYNTTNFAVLSGTGPLLCNAGDTIDVRVAQNSGSNIALTADVLNNYVTIRRIA